MGRGQGGLSPLSLSRRGYIIYVPPPNPPPPYAAYHCMIFGNPAKPIVCLLLYTINITKKSSFQLKLAIDWIGNVGACDTETKILTLYDGL